MAACYVAAFHACDFERHDLGVERCNDRMERTHPAERAVAPTHRFRPGKLRYCFGQKLGEDIKRRPALAVDHRDVEIALRVAALLALIERDAGGFEEAFDRFL